MSRPLILVDGVLAVITSAKTRRRLCYHEGWIQRRVYAGDRYRLILNPAHGPMLWRLTQETGAELAWATTWEEYANLCVGPLLGLPRLPVAPVPDPGHKAAGVVPWTAGRPFAWFDDEVNAEAVAALAGDQPHLVIPVDEGTGLTEDHVAVAREWLLFRAKLSRRDETGSP